uniref:Uncharacterized protein n=1 Tax=Anguilla anguilla TaxID=7936 RepID=A0A0E9XG03_ANGAN
MGPPAQTEVAECVCQLRCTSPKRSQCRYGRTHIIASVLSAP